jgi:phosphatidate phosphatase PAH1
MKILVLCVRSSRRSIGNERTFYRRGAIVIYDNNFQVEDKIKALYLKHTNTKMTKELDSSFDHQFEYFYYGDSTDRVYKNGNISDKDHYKIGRMTFAFSLMGVFFGQEELFLKICKEISEEYDKYVESKDIKRQNLVMAIKKAIDKLKAINLIPESICLNEEKMSLFKDSKNKDFAIFGYKIVYFPINIVMSREEFGRFFPIRD